MNEKKLTLNNTLRAASYLSFVFLVLAPLWYAIAWWFGQVDEKAQLQAYLLLVSIIMVNPIIDAYDWALKKFCTCKE
tara:strand:- start:479 stop:709 length:231 start_codon:yes stop_codon:yes gene_type:complete